MIDLDYDDIVSKIRYLTATADNDTEKLTQAILKSINIEPAKE